ncbi:8291_t:CDS:2 [Dentiscutata erythropus]|uniref:8291_t:CDS:1 n=1 Tax=Dentiscutata erythropus TaxID=1348616 RepID=A0A9N9CBX2_9GLOM|nr:8291_t:CDS:2 [Dentiscutata erythropus]
MTNKLSEEEIEKLFKKFDANGNGILSLSEIQTAVISTYPQYKENKPAIMRAYKAADASKDGYVQLEEFGRLIDLLHYYNELYEIFQKLDVDHDKRITFEEFKKGHKLIKLQGLSDEELKEEFTKIDTNNGGLILFDEFCIYAAKRKLLKKDF